MLSRILKELAITFTLCLGERVLERIMFPGLHRAPGRVVTDDLSRVDSMTTLIAEALGLLAIIWVFVGALFVIGFLIRRPLLPMVPTLVAAVILVLIFAGATSQWLTMPTMPTMPMPTMP